MVFNNGEQGKCTKEAANFMKAQCSVNSHANIQSVFTAYWSSPQLPELEHGASSHPRRGLRGGYGNDAQISRTSHLRFHWIGKCVTGT